ncbi:hypothetical protein [Marinobacterium sediminicola]|uniref:hypothetical protein n=1 Tax=Marinobacterium sediminicola TaxID=518898 RepID=UPI001EEFE48D|nr:hypothetical protein [Marinobacterium sediminicola]ULG70719.1 hypothetical protein LN244_07900 [Marinobacterium sediminicola]
MTLAVVVLLFCALQHEVTLLISKTTVKHFLCIAQKIVQALSKTSDQGMYLATNQNEQRWKPSENSLFLTRAALQ